jgi:hypothetical protein
MDKIIIDNIFISDHKLLLEYINKIINYCKQLVEEAESEKNINKCMMLVFKHMYLIDYLYKNIGLMHAVGYIKVDKNSIAIDSLIESHIKYFFSNTNIFQKLLESKKIKFLDEERYAIDLLIKKFETMSSKSNTENLIQKSISEIKNKIDKSVCIDVSPTIKKYIGNHTNSICVNKEVYNYLVKKIPDTYVRNIIEKAYFEKSNNSLREFTNLLVLRHNLAKDKGFESWFEYKKNKLSVKSSDVRNLINDIIPKIEQKTRKEAERIIRELRKDGYTKKIDIHDIVYYYDKLKPTAKFIPQNVIQILFECVYEYFGIRIEQIKYSGKLWNDCVVSYKVILNDEVNSEIFLGYMHMDLEKRPTKNISTPTFFDITHRFISDEITYHTQVALITAYKSVSEPCMTYSDIILLFQEFGYLIRSLSFISTKGICLNEFNNLLPQIMEHVAWNEKVVRKICEGINNSICDHILFMKNINYTIMIKLKCINALFDHILHSSTSIIQQINKFNSEKKNPEIVIQSLYAMLYAEIIGGQKDLINTQPNGINPSLIYEMISGGETNIYESILTEILSFGIYHVIQKGHGREFIQKINSNLFQMKKNIYTFSEKHGKDSYYFFLQEIVGGSVGSNSNSDIQTNIVESSANNFTDDSDENIDSENIIDDRKINY